jgi:adenylate kinase family enzyme
MVKLVQAKIEKNNYGGRYLLDGFPRGQENMDVWEKTMEKYVNLKAVIYYDCAEDELKRRLMKRGETSGRSDDNEESIVKRLKVFNDHTRPVLEHYNKLGKLKRIDANRTIEAITADTESMLDNIGVFPQ